MRRIYSNLAALNAKQRFRGERKLLRARDLVLTPLALIGAACLGTPGLKVRMDLINRFLRAALVGQLPRGVCLDLVLDTFDSVRYFEMDFAARHAVAPRSRVLDVSSPRALGIWLLIEGGARHVTFCNPHAVDLGLTRDLVRALGLLERCDLSLNDASSLPGAVGTYDLVTSMSVVEHIPDGEDCAAVQAMWSRVRPGGRLLLTMPVAAEAFEEYMDVNAYERPLEAVGAYVLGQRFYDERLLAERIFSVTGSPKAMEVYGERAPGTVFSRRERRLRSLSYPRWSEPLHMAHRYAWFPSVGRLPALGVAAMVFVKP